MNYAFLAHVDAGETAKLATKLDARMAAQAIPESTRAAMRERWLFANETVAMGDAKIAGMLHALPSATLTATLLRTQLLHKLQLFVPDRRAADPDSGHAAVLELQQSIEAAIAKLAAHCAPEVARPPGAAAAADAQA